MIEQLSNKGMKVEFFYPEILFDKLLREIFFKLWNPADSEMFDSGFYDNESCSSSFKDIKASKVCPSRLFLDKLNFFNWGSLSPKFNITKSLSWIWHSFSFKIFKFWKDPLLFASTMTLICLILYRLEIVKFSKKWIFLSNYVNSSKT